MKFSPRLLFVFFLFMSVSSMGQPAQWITSADCRHQENTWIAFCKEITIAQCPQSLPVRIAADSKYWLWINEQMVIFEGGLKRGPTPRDTYCDSINMAPYLKKGKNTIAILLWHFGKDGFSHKSSGKAALFFEAVGDSISIVSDTTWLSRMHPAYERAGNPRPNFRHCEPNLRFNANKDLVGWYKKDYDVVTNGFLASIPLGKEQTSPWNTLVKRPIPQWKDYGIKSYVKTELKHGKTYDTLIAYLPYNCQITPIFTVEADSGKLVYISTDNTYAGGYVNLRAEYITKQGLQAYESLGWLNGHQVFYIFPKGVNIKRVQYRETGYGTEFAGSFHCDNAFFNSLWEKSRRTAYVNMRDTYMDCPDRERAQWWGDESNALKTLFYAFDTQSYALCKKGMYELINWQRRNGVLYSPIPGNWDQELPGQMLAAIGYLGFWDYYRYTGHRQTIADVYGGVKRYMDVWRLGANGLIVHRQGEWPWGDWGNNVDLRLLYNAWYFLALKGVYHMAVLLENEQDAELYYNQMGAYKEAFNREFWTGECYRSPNYKDLPDDRVQALAVLSGLADRDKYPALLEIFKTQEHASPYMEKYVAEALFEMGQGGYALQRIQKRFAYMVNHPDYTTLFEGWGIGKNGFGGGTVNHGYSTGLLAVLDQYVCGMSPWSAGYDTICIAPQPGIIQNLSSQIPTIKGLIGISWVNASAKFSLKLDTPQKTFTAVSFPDFQKMKKVTANGKTVWVNNVFHEQENVKLFKIDDHGMPVFLVPSGKWKWEVVK